MKFSSIKLQGDRAIWMITFFLALTSLLAVYSAISTLAVKGEVSTVKFLIKHAGMLFAGFAVMYIVHRIPFSMFTRWSMIGILIAAGLLVLAYIVGKNLNAASRWLPIPFTGLTVQPSDFAKIALVVHVAATLSAKRNLLSDFKLGVWPVVWPIILICGLILPANFSTAAMLAFICFILMFMAGVPWKHMGRIALFGVGFLFLIILIGETTPYLGRYQTWKNRIFSKVEDDSEGNYQTDLAKYAIHEGGVIPKGPGTGSSRNFLPHPYSDMIFPFIIEEYGSVLGGFVLVMLYVILLFRSIRLSSKNPKMSAQLAALGLAFMLCTQAFINMAVAVSLFPTTGQPLPLVSMGGTSAVFTSLALGFILGIIREREVAEADEDSTLTVNPTPA